jgi:hypothetical protein
LVVEGGVYHSAKILKNENRHHNKNHAESINDTRQNVDNANTTSKIPERPIGQECLPKARLDFALQIN